MSTNQGFFYIDGIPTKGLWVDLDDVTEWEDVPMNNKPQPTLLDIIGACLLGCVLSITWYVSYLVGINAL